MLIKKVKHRKLFLRSYTAMLIYCYSQAVAVRKHLERNRKDKDGKFRLILIESRIHRLSRYYKAVGVLPPTWRYESATANTLVA